MSRDYRANPLTDAERASIQVIRGVMASFGHDTSDFTDEELADGVDAFAEVSRQASLSFEEANEAFSSLARAWNA